MSREAFEQILKRRATRRTALASAGAALIGLSLPGRPTRTLAMQESTPAPVWVDFTGRPSDTFGVYPFQLGVASGEPGPHSLVLWTRLAPAPSDGGGMDPIPYAVDWEIARDENFGDVVQTGMAVADPNLAHSVHVDVTGLEPSTEYFYRFRCKGEVSQTGRTITAPAPDAADGTLRFGVSSCANYEDGYFIAYRAMAEERFDAILHLGDYIYEWGESEWNVRQPEHIAPYTTGLAIALEDYRNRYAQYHIDPDLRAMRASAPLIATWDDHEVANNYAGDHPDDNVPQQEFLERRADAYQAYYEHMPLHPWSMPLGANMMLYRSLQFGQLAQITVLDTRQYRDPHPSGNGIYPRTPASVDPNTTMLGHDQERWLLQQLDASTATWNVLAQQVMFAETYFPQPDGEVITWYNDSWTGYPEARQRIIRHIAEAQIDNPIVLTGDIHTSWAADVKLNWDDPTEPPVGAEYITTSITSGGVEPSNSVQPYYDALDYVRFFDGHHGGFLSIEVTPELWTTAYVIVDDMQDVDSDVRTIATWVTEAGNPGVQQG